MMLRFTRHFVAASLAVLASGVFAPVLAAQAIDMGQFEGLKWRLIGPFRGGRSTAVCGVVGRPSEFYMGTTGGGLWKTIDAGVNWECVSDGYFRTGSVGAVAASRSNPDIVYAGMGEACIRGNISHGDGVYRSADGGKTWGHVGLKETQTIGRIVVHPTNPDIVYVAALGHIYGANKERGVYKTTDGGKTWRQVLYVSERAGAVDLSLDVHNPETLYAATWEAWRTAYSLNSGGPGSKLFKTTDGGRNWTDLSQARGMPGGPLGRIGVSVSPADSNVVYAIVEALEGGVFRSDDAGTTWTLTNSDRNYRQRAWYYTHIAADPKNKDTVYVLNVGMGRSTDGGKTFRGVGTPHSDNHDLWIDPDDPNRLANANDGGANVSQDGGRTWTRQDYATAQLYHVSADNAFPYRVLAAQQDNSTVRIPSRTAGAGITSSDWTSTAGGESGYVVAKPDDPEIVFGGSYGGYLQRLNHRLNSSRNINFWPDNPMGHGAADLAHRIQWTFPIVFSPHDPNVLYSCSQFVMKSTNEGQTWQKISPDLTKNDKSKMGPSGGPITKDNTSVEYYGTVFTLAESPKKPGVLWAGSDDGWVSVTLDGGKAWQRVTPAGMPEWGLCSMIDASAHAEGTAYLAVDNHENDDLAPYIYRTHDFGKSWTKIVSGLPEDSYVRVVREDPKMRGLLYAGAETGVWVSFNDGALWQPLQFNLPVVPVHDLVIKDDDLIAATHGRSIWILDDLSLLRQANPSGGLATRLFKPRDNYRVSGGGGFGRRPQAREEEPEPTGENPPMGFVVTYSIQEPAESVLIEVSDARGVVVGRREGAPSAKGLHKVPIRLQYSSYRSVPGMIFWAAGSRPIPAPPGTYTIRLVVDGAAQMVDGRFVLPPNSEATEEDAVLQCDLARRISARVDDANQAVLKARDVRKKVADASEAAGKSGKDPKAISSAQEGASRLGAQLTEIEEAIYQVKNRSGQDPLNYPIRLNNKIAALLGVVLSGDFRPTDAAYEVFNALSGELQTHLDRLESLLTKDLNALNTQFQALGIERVAPDTSGGGVAP